MWASYYDLDFSAHAIDQGPQVTAHAQHIPKLLAHLVGHGPLCPYTRYLNLSVSTPRSYWQPIEEPQHKK